MHSDPIADMLTRIRNACRARKQRVEVPASKIKEKILEILKVEGFVEDFRFVSGSTAQGVYEIKLKYDAANEPVITDLQRSSRPGLRRYVGSGDLPKVRGGQGIMILTTSKGVMTDREARKSHVGGEALCSVW